MVRRSSTEELLRSDDAPEDATVKMHSRQWTRKAVDRVDLAKARNECEHPIQNANLRKTRYERCDHLYHEHDLWWNLHVLTQLEIRREFDSLGRADVTISRENHVRHWPSGKSVSAHKLRNEVKTEVLICDRHDDSNGNEHHSCDCQRQE